MRYNEIIQTSKNKIIPETDKTRPLTPEEARARRKKVDQANANIADVAAAAALKLATARRKAAEV
ncbi:hypothetical protein [Acidisphaera sp. L21]|uniref:hypothetical protein n=1 Tax=Acidisphaera sp. L21 TaxID=1641851 RepID=UPI00131C5341|nr:hypothetical protein [Acidisphaera sp. L21]